MEGVSSNNRSPAIELLFLYRLRKLIMTGILPFHKVLIITQKLVFCILSVSTVHTNDDIHSMLTDFTTCGYHCRLPYKRNPMRSVRCCSLPGHSLSLVSNYVHHILTVQCMAAQLEQQTCTLMHCMFTFTLTL